MKSSRILLFGSALFFAAPAFAEDIPAKACTGQDCMPQDVKPAEECEGQNCATPPAQGMTDCMGQDCATIEPQPGPRIETVEPPPAQ